MQLDDRSIERLDAKNISATLFESIMGEIGALRVRAWESRSVTLPNALGGQLVDKFDYVASHFFIRQSGVVVAAARLTAHKIDDRLPDGLHWSDTGSVGGPLVVCLGRLAVAESSRRMGFARTLDEMRIAHGLELKCSHFLVCTSNQSRVCALQELGFELVRSTQSEVTALPATVLRRVVIA